MNPILYAWLGLGALGSWMFFKYPAPKFRLGQRVMTNPGAVYSPHFDPEGKGNAALNLSVIGEIIGMRKHYDANAVQKKTWVYDIQASPPMVPGMPIKPAITFIVTEPNVWNRYT